MATDQTAATGVAERYASALFDLAKEQNAQAAIEQDLAKFQRLMDESADLRRLILSPAFSAKDQSRAVTAVMAKAGIGGLASNFVKVLAHNRRLFTISDVIKNYRLIAARARGEVSADVTSAHPLTDVQVQALKAQLKASVGREVTLQSKVDPTLLGGLVVKVGSRMIDSSLRTKIEQLKVAMKGTG